MNIVLSQDSFDENGVFSVSKYLIEDNFDIYKGWYVYIKYKNQYMWLHNSDIVENNQDEYLIKWRPEGVIPEKNNDPV